MKYQYTRSEILENFWAEYMLYVKQANEEANAHNSKLPENALPEQRIGILWPSENHFWVWYMDNKLKLASAKNIKK